VKKFDKELWKWRVKDYFWWLRIYKRRLLYTFLVCELLLMLSVMGFNRLVDRYRPWFGKSEPVTVYEPLTEQEKLKLERCTQFVYILMRENAQLRDRCE